MSLSKDFIRVAMSSDEDSRVAKRKMRGEEERRRRSLLDYEGTLQ
jgi:hypothetical protein